MVNCRCPGNDRGLLQLAEARGDRPALLNAMRGQAMICPFMGHAIAARESIERAVEAFNASTRKRLAARAAGQDAGVADLALMSWVLWLLGHADTAITRIMPPFNGPTPSIIRIRRLMPAIMRLFFTLFVASSRLRTALPNAVSSYRRNTIPAMARFGTRLRGICATFLDPSSARSRKSGLRSMNIVARDISSASRRFTYSCVRLCYSATIARLRWS